METLKIFFSTLIIMVITTIVYFSLYFLFPEVSDAVFGISYKNGCSLELSIPDREDDTAKEVPAEEEDTVLVEAGTTEPLIEPEVEAVADVQPQQGISEQEQSVLDFLEGSKGQLIVSALQKEKVLSTDFSVESLVESEEGRMALRKISSYVESTGKSLDDLVSNADVGKLLSGQKEAISFLVDAIVPKN